MRIRVNGDPVELPAELTILQLLEQLHIDPRLVAVEHNLTIIKRARYDSTAIADGDAIEIVNFVGGGQNVQRATCYVQTCCVQTRLNWELGTGNFSNDF